MNIWRELPRRGACRLENKGALIFGESYRGEEPSFLEGKGTLKRLQTPYNCCFKIFAMPRFVTRDNHSLLESKSALKRLQTPYNCCFKVFWDAKLCDT